MARTSPPGLVGSSLFSLHRCDILLCWYAEKDSFSKVHAFLRRSALSMRTSGVALPAGLPVTPRSFHQPHMRPPQTLDLFVVILQPLDLSDRLLFLRGEDFRGPFLKCWWPMSGELVSDQTVHWASLSPLGSLRQVTETGSHYSSVCSPTQSPGTMGRWKRVALHFAREKTRKLI